MVSYIHKRFADPIIPQTYELSQDNLQVKETGATASATKEEEVGDTKTVSSQKRDQATSEKVLIYPLRRCSIAMILITSSLSNLKCQSVKKIRNSKHNNSRMVRIE